MVKKTVLLLTLISCLFVLSGCGQTGPLYLPQPKAQQASQ